MMPAGLLMLPTLAWACPNCPSDGRTRVATGIVDTFWDTADGARPGDAIVARPLTTMTTPGPATTILRPDADWQRGPLCQHRGADVDWHTTEGACVVKRDGT